MARPEIPKCLGQAWISLCRRGLPVGAVVSDVSGIVSSGRNRVYDPSGGIDRLQRTPLAHAEMNAIAAVRDDVELAKCEIWTTQRPCSMCTAAITFTEIPAVHYLASDPSDPCRSGPYTSSGLSDDIWTVVANALFLHNVAWVVGSANPMLADNRPAEPEVVSLALDLVDRQNPDRAGEDGSWRRGGPGSSLGSGGVRWVG